MGVITRLAEGAAARVFVVEGAEPPAPVHALRAHRGVELLDSPRSATVLLIAGRLPESLHEATRRVHDAMAQPRCTLWFGAPPGEVGTPIPGAQRLDLAGDAASNDDRLAALAAALRRTQRELLRGERASEPALLPDVDPAPWRGVGPFGQGGAGMTGGVPYGRPMTGRAPDRDGLELDQLPVRVGPFFAPFPAGLVLDVELQGDVIQEVVVPGNVFATAEPPRTCDVFHAALTDAVSIAALERARAEHHLRWLAHMLRVHGLEALGRRVLALAREIPGSASNDALGQVVALRRLLERTMALGWATADVGCTTAVLVKQRGLGPVARAAGLEEDVRMTDPAYLALGFAPVVQSAASSTGDAHARWRQRLAEAEQSLTLALRAGDQRTGGGGRPIEGPRGPLYPNARDESPTCTLVTLLPSLLAGLEWGDAVTTIVSLDIDLRESAYNAAPLAPQPTVKPMGGMGGMAGMAGMETMATT